MKPGPNAWPLLQSWLFSALLSAFTAAISTSTLFMATTIVGSFLQTGASLFDWIALPLMLVIYAASAGFVAMIMGLPITLACAAVGIAIMGLAEFTWPMFRHWLWWCLLGIVIAWCAAQVVMAVWGPYISELLPTIFASALIGAIVARKCCHRCVAPFRIDASHGFPTATVQ